MSERQKKFVWTFVKLVESFNYTEWIKNMKFVLFDSNLISATTDEWNKSEASDFDSKENFRVKKKTWDTINVKAKSKIDLMCQRIVQMILKKEFIAKNMWKQLKKDCILKKWNNKWKIMSKLKHLHLIKVKNMNEFHA